jgi:hypothetical protein
VTWRYEEWRAIHDLPLGVTRRLEAGTRVKAGDIIANGTVYGATVRVGGARRLGVAPSDVERVMRVPLGAEVEKGAILARTGRRFARAVSAPIDGRVIHLRADGDFELATVIDRWTVRSTLDGLVRESDDSAVTIEGFAWGLQGVAAYGPDAVGDLAAMLSSGVEELQPSRIDVRHRDRILVGGARSAAESIARAHACGAAAVVAGAVPASGLRVLFGDDTGAQSKPRSGDLPTVLCLLGFGSAPLPAQIFGPLSELAGARAAIHSASARLFVFAPRDAVRPGAQAPSLALVNDWAALRPLDGTVTLGDEMVFASEIAARAVVTADGPIPAANVRSMS